MSHYPFPQQIAYSEKYYDKNYEYRNVYLNKDTFDQMDD
jgi:hypothetical protein